MLLHIGDNEGVPLQRLLFVLNERNMQPLTRAYIEKAKKEHRYFSCGAKPKAYAVTFEHGREMVYESMIASATLQKRWREELQRKQLNELAIYTITPE